MNYIAVLVIVAALILNERLIKQTRLLRRFNERLDSMDTKIAAFVTSQEAFNTRQASAVDAIGRGVTGLTGDVKTLNDKITELQNSSGTVTPEDQARIDALQLQGEALATKSEALAKSISELDALTPPPVPVTPPETPPAAPTP